MFEFLKKILEPGGGVDFAELARQGAQIVDVRSKDEFRGGHINGAVNIPVQSLRDRLADLRKDKPVITCCASGGRSAAAKRMLEAEGFSHVHNGGGWQGLQSQLR
jgi:phage shock protein E